MLMPVFRMNGMASHTGAAFCISMLALAAPLLGAAHAADQAPVCVENASLTDLMSALLAGRTTALALTRAYLARIAAYDAARPKLNAVREVNPDALAIAARLDAARPDARQPLWGIPILIKDTIATGDRQHTMAGSLALADARARRDATLVTQLRRAGAIILGKTNLTEFGNALVLDMPDGYSSLGGQVRNPYAPELDERGVPAIPSGAPSVCKVGTSDGGSGFFRCELQTPTS
jgi:amidase